MQPPGPARLLPTPNWDPVRLAKVERNYSMNYIHTILPAMAEVLGPADTRSVATVVGHQIGMQYHQHVMEMLGYDGPLHERLIKLLGGHGPRCEYSEVGGVSRVRMSEWRLFDAATVHPVVFESWRVVGGAGDNGRQTPRRRAAARSGRRQLRVGGP